MVTTPNDSMAPNNVVARVTKCKSSELVRNACCIELVFYEKGDNSGLKTVNISDVYSIHSIQDEILSYPVHLLWLHGTCSTNVSMSGWKMGSWRGLHKEILINVLGYSVFHS
ncbi:hypothetical protein AVEN_156910-1 [Araneus ventricosus]|uniref:Uncharacterized protein n=1 Tax=Araneus ventricosus TaxID=182803 RepID=A0A4Y2EP00_ARAVE|nr:hypothetical protein AVEN_156910-1 [Araneus ventricosus]